MSRLTYTAIGIPFFLSLAVLAQTGVPPALAKAYAEFDSATTKGDKATVQRLMTDDAIWVNRAGRLRDTKTLVQEIEPSTGQSMPPDIRAYPGGAIVVFTRRAADGTTSRVLQVWIQQGGAWKLAAHHGVPADPKEKVEPATAASSPLPPNAGSPADIKTIETAIESLSAGNQRGDAKNFAASVTDQFVSVTVNGVGSKQSRVEDLSKTQPQVASDSKVEQSSTRVYGDIAITNRISRGQNGSAAITIVHVKQNGKWLRAGIAFAPIAAAK